jgi:hypothetical protein
MIKNKSHSNEKKQAVNPKTGLWVKRDGGSGKSLTPKGDSRPFTGVRKEALDKLGSTLNKLAKYDKESS